MRATIATSLMIGALALTVPALPGVSGGAAIKLPDLANRESSETTIQSLAGDRREQQPLIYLVNTLTSSAARNTLANIRPSGSATPGSTWNIEQIFYTVPFR